jgi:hypothetical protein
MSDENKEPDLPPATLELRQTRLRVEEGELVRRNETGGIIMRVPLDDIETVQFVRKLNALAFAALGVAAGMVAIGYFVSEYNVVTVLLYVAAMFLAVFSLIGVREDVFVVRSRGEDIRVSCPDPSDAVAGFAASLKPLVGGPRGP